MLKRKRDSEDEDGSRDGDAPSVQLSVPQQRIQHKIGQGSKKLAHAFKVAKGFERQKLGRRRKKAASENHTKDIERIDAEIEALKAFDNAGSARLHLYKTLLKTKSIAEHPNVPADIGNTTALSIHTPTLNVNARLCKSNPVKEALHGILVDLQNALGIEAERPVAIKNARLRAKDYEKAEKRVEGSGPDVLAESKDIASALSIKKGKDEGRHSTSTDQDSLAAFNDRIASSQSEEEASDAEDLEHGLPMEHVRHESKNHEAKRYDFAVDMSLSGSESDAPSALAELEKAPGPKRSAFLPSLTMGGYISGSGSDIDDEIDVAPRKNRRGQRARQQIWEKKYGSKAKHLYKQERNEGWDPKRGATDTSDRRGRGAYRTRGNGRHDTANNGPRFGGERSGQDVLKKREGRRDDSGPIHPSWEAAKRAKAKKAEPVAFQGKKITFD